MPVVYLLTGGNIGNTEQQLSNAARIINLRVGNVIEKSALYKTEPWGNKQQQFFLNQVLMVQTDMQPELLMRELLEIEKSMGRMREEKWEPRIIDIDMLLYDNLILETALLTIPHPHMHERNFVLVPLSEIAPQLMHPLLHQTIIQLLWNSPDKCLVEKM
jgi:2-amino-4-hydroxy-6-hydroxymethyldihydropteridine diphosphokinase